MNAMTWDFFLNINGDILRKKMNLMFKKHDGIHFDVVSVVLTAYVTLVLV